MCKDFAKICEGLKLLEWLECPDLHHWVRGYAEMEPDAQEELFVKNQTGYFSKFLTAWFIYKHTGKLLIPTDKTNALECRVCEVLMQQINRFASEYEIQANLNCKPPRLTLLKKEQTKQ